MVLRATVGLAVPLTLVLLAGVTYLLHDKPADSANATSLLPTADDNISLNGLPLFLNEYLKLCPVKLRTVLHRPTTNNEVGNLDGTTTRQLNISAVDNTASQNIPNGSSIHNRNTSTNQRTILGLRSTYNPDGNNQKPDNEHEVHNPVSTKTAPKSGTKTSTNATAVICHILLGALLLVSASIALFEVCRDRLSDKINQQGAGAASPAAAVDTRRCSLADLTVIRHARRESVQHQQQQHHQNHRLQSAVSFDSSTGPPGTAARSSYRLLGARPPPLQRRSSFPVPLSTPPPSSGLGVTVELSRSPSGSGTPTAKLSRRPSVEHSEDDSSPDTRRRVRIIRRH